MSDWIQAFGKAPEDWTPTFGKTPVGIKPECTFGERTSNPKFPKVYIEATWFAIALLPPFGL